MSGVGPVEPGEGTRAWDAPLAARPPRGRPERFWSRHRRAVLAGATAAALVAVCGYLYATRPEPEPPAPVTYPSQVVGVTYLGPGEATARNGSFAFAVELIARSGPQVTVERISQPYAGLSLASTPRPPFRTETGIHHKITITMKVTDCGKVPRNAGLPFLDVTLRNTRAIEAHSFILGERYAHDLSEALQVACSNDFMTPPKP
ncbi:Tat pathway signal sequence domain protein [Streptomyces sp. PSKA30]|uniref:Tat pathway signal sequence domain protein n=1 Tax=Streptomyces sp. PSKA30 TaxID=2874597 RepID=UPI001CD129B1|nr:Tat pathway signal sequence domain protein [Streptomyces sp. PSKA30]MBZ9643225.1 Tat pathway signal sequence domain protein [Streptomyces sp. PSKA30]